MKTPSISLKRSLDVTLKDFFQRLKVLNEIDSKALRDEYKEWIEASKGENKQPYILYMNQITPDN
tara:strand:- start:154 stop:348 length:195 start_codon:yes stop_codon:yes gene_type:complete